MNIPPKFMWTWPSLLVESIGAVVLFGIFCLIPIPPLRWVLEQALSQLYEHKWDRNGFEWKDVLQRIPVLLILEVVWTLRVNHGHLWPI